MPIERKISWLRENHVNCVQVWKAEKPSLTTLFQSGGFDHMRSVELVAIDTAIEHTVFRNQTANRLDARWVAKHNLDKAQAAFDATA